VVVPGTGICWQNRSISFALDPAALNHLQPGRKPFHTLNPSLARFADGRVMPFGTMGGEGQPQTQAAVYTRYARFGQPLQQAVSAPRWLLGRSWGDVSTSLKLEPRIDPAVVAQLQAAGHAVDVLAEPPSDTMGHAGALVRHADGRIEGAADPRSDGRQRVGERQQRARCSLLPFVKSRHSQFVERRLSNNAKDSNEPYAVEARRAFHAPNIAISPGTMIMAQMILLKLACTQGTLPNR